MHRKKIIFAAFILLALVQLYVPAKMILDRETVLRTGTEYKFRTAPVDPADPFRGKYIALNYRDNSFVTSKAEDWKMGETIYASITTDTAGYAIIKSISKQKPTANGDFIKAKVWNVSNVKPFKIMIDYPFDRFYMEESKAYDAERVYRETEQINEHKTYVLVNVLHGEAVLRDVLIDGKSIAEIVKANKKRRQK